MKRCPKCDTDKPIAEFYAKPERHDGLSGWCIPCENQAGKDSARRLYLKVVEHLGGACAHCGYDVPGPALQIDHVNGDGATERKANAGWRKMLHAALIDEDGRYQLLCANCNQIKRMENGEHSRPGPRRTGTDPTLTKTCPRCREIKPHSEFYKNAARYDGLTVYCGPCMLAVGEAAVQQARAAALTHLGNLCASCGYSEDSRALQIDHMEGGGRAGRKTHRTKTRFYRDVLVAKPGVYQCLCANCNVLKKVEQREFRPRSTYRHNPATERRPTRRYLPEAEIREAIRLHQEEGWTQRAAAAKFGISQPTLSQHITRRVLAQRQQ